MLKKSVGIVAVATALSLVVPTFAQAEPVTVGCSPVVSANIGFDDREPGWVNRYADTFGGCQAVAGGDGAQVAVVKPVVLDYQKSDDLVSDIIQDALNHAGASGLEFSGESTLNYDSATQMRRTASHKFPAPIWGSAQQRNDMNKSLIEYFESIGADPAKIDYLESGTPAQQTRATVYPLPGTKAEVTWTYANQGQNLDTQPSNQVTGNAEYFTINVLISFTGEPGESTSRTFVSH